MTHSAEPEERDPILPPHDPHAEEAVLGSILKSPLAIAAVQHLAPEDFYSHRYRCIWRGVLDLWERNEPIDYTSIAAALKRHGTYEQAGGMVALSEIGLAIPTAAHIEHYAQLVANAATQRRYIAAAQRIAELFWPAGADVQELAAQAEALLSAAQARDSRRDLYDPQGWANAFADDLEARSNGQRTAVLTGLGALDTMTLGLEAGGLYLLMGTPGTGKTELAMQVGMHVALTHGTVLFASLEMSAVELAHRYARISQGLNRNRLAKGTIESGEEPRISEAINAMSKLPFWPASPRGQYTTGDLRADALEVQSRAGHLGLIVADYVQRFRDRGSKTSTREENIGLVAENLKSLAREFGCPVLAPVQPNREYVQRGNKRPLLSDLRESGKLEQEADVVLGLYRDEKHDDKTDDRGIAELHMLKNRSGVGDADGMRRVAWRGHRYDDYEARSHQSPAPWAA